jgi:hypothetical protein|tara:strand:+ start:9 stop:275 length:267 start_codon:yes stop_codon:yes gene_type:complete
MRKEDKIMNIKDMKTKMINGPEDGTIFALIKNDLVYLVTAHSGVEAMYRLEKMKVAPADRWLPSNKKAVLIPGIWEYEMFQYVPPRRV